MVEYRNNPSRGRGQLRSASSDPGLASASRNSNSSYEGRLGSTTSSLDLSATRSLGSRGSLCDNEADDCDSVNVVVRCRPLNEKEIKRRDECILSFPGEGQIWVNLDGVNGKNVQKPKVFTYNVVFESESTQEDTLEHSGIKKLIDMAIDGFSCTVFCYGQTGSGKTHTLTGPPHLFGKEEADLYSLDHGLIFRSFVYMFNQLQTFGDKEFTVTASFLEIYNEKVIDLLNMGTNQKPLQVRWSKKQRGFFVENLFSIECYELDDLLAVLEEGLRNRAVASHNMNEYSSRSHTILTVQITSEQKAEEGVTITKIGKLNFVDLAGSEMTKKTNSEGKTLEEANNINKSLMVLGTCISALSDPKKKDGHIPYRDSKLTKLLADSLAGSGVTLMIACVSPAKYNLSETLNTLRYASRAKRIRTKPIVIMDPKEKAILSLQREVNMLQEENDHLKMLIDFGNTTTPPGLGGLVSNLHRIESPGYADNAKSAALALAATVGNSNALRKGIQQARRPSLRVDDEKLRSLEVPELITLVKKYMVEHDNVKKENKELQLLTGALVEDQEVMAKENERLIKKMDDYKSGVSPRSTLGSPRPLPVKSSNEYKGSNAVSKKGNTQVWVNPMNQPSNKKEEKRRSPKPKESNGPPPKTNKKKIGRSMADLSDSGNSSRGSSGSFEDRAPRDRSRPSNKKSPPQKTNSKKNPPPRSKSVPRTMKVADKKGNSRDRKANERQRR